VLYDANINNDADDTVIKKKYNRHTHIYDISMRNILDLFHFYFSFLGDYCIMQM